MGTVIRLANLKSDRASLATFTLRDRCDLEGWVEPDRHMTIVSCDMGSFALLYRAGTPWASWGIARQDRVVVVWDCVSLTDIGRFPSMSDALAGLPLPRSAIPAPSVLPFAATQRRCAASR